MSRRFAARVIADFGRSYIVTDEQGAIIPAVRRGKRDDVVVGDQVQCLGDDTEAVIESIAPRARLLFRSALTRTKLLAANVDQMAIVYAAQPAFNPAFIWRALVAAAAADVTPVLVRNKIEVDDPQQRAARIFEQVQRLGIAAIQVSVKSQPDAARQTLLEQTGGHATLLIGQSGMGKSSIVNLLVPGGRERTAEFSIRLNIGKQTTTASRWFDLPGGGALVDAPGFQRFGLAHVAPRALASLMPDLAPLTGDCRFADCLHAGEPDCAVGAAAADGRIDLDRLGFYRELLAELRA